jgi:S-adenosylmethionine/arginine decarboxylase-like enzyme
MFDHTLMLYYEQVPVIESWALTFATNRKDLLTPNPENMNKWGNIKTHLSTFNATTTDVNDHFYLAHDYQQNDARAQGRCEVGRAGNSVKTPLAGILLVVDAEEISTDEELLRDWSKVEDVLQSIFVKELGWTLLSSVSHEAKRGRQLGTMIFKEGAVTARSWPKERYCALDVQLWSSFDKLQRMKRLIVTSFKSKTASSFRVITSGMLGTLTESEDRKTVGPPGINYRDCTGEGHPNEGEEDNTSSGINRKLLDTVIQESLAMIQETKGVILVICGNPKDSCPMFELVSSVAKNGTTKGSIWSPVVFWTCEGVEMVNTSNFMIYEQTQAMLSCNNKIQNEMEDAVKKNGQIVAFAMDQSSPIGMAMVADRVWRNDSNQQELLSDQFTFFAPMGERSNESWRRDFLELRRAEMIDYDHLFRAEVIVQEDAENVLEMGILSGRDNQFFSRLVNVTNEIRRKTSVSTRIRQIEGGVEEIDIDQQHMEWLNESDFERPGEAHFGTQKPLGEQHLVQFKMEATEERNPNTPKMLEHILSNAFKRPSGERFDVRTTSESVGLGLIIAAVCPEGTALVVWNGEDRLDLNVFSYQLDFLDTTIAAFALHPQLKKRISLDEFPRGVGRVVNLRRDMQKWTGTE